MVCPITSHLAGHWLGRMELDAGECLWETAEMKKSAPRLMSEWSFIDHMGLWKSLGK